MWTRWVVPLISAGLVGGCATLRNDAPPPHLDRVELRATVQRYEKIYPTFYFHAPGGDVVAVRRQIVSATGANRNFNPVSRIDIAPDQQKRGAVWVGGWGCGPNASATTVRAFLLDRRGNKSNELEYTVVCKGAAEVFGSGPGGPR
jgi:hypothetical protein